MFIKVERSVVGGTDYAKLLVLARVCFAPISW